MVRARAITQGALVDPKWNAAVTRGPSQRVIWPAGLAKGVPRSIGKRAESARTNADHGHVRDSDGIRSRPGPQVNASSGATRISCGPIAPAA